MKVFIDLFIGVWAFVLALVWVYGINKHKGETVAVGEVWQRFPKFVLGYAATFLVLFAWSLLSPLKPVR